MRRVAPSILAEGTAAASEGARHWAALPAVGTLRGALAELVERLNEDAAEAGEAERLVLNAVEGAGFIGIAVALMGRSHPLGVFLASPGI